MTGKIRPSAIGSRFEAAPPRAGLTTTHRQARRTVPGLAWAPLLLRLFVVIPPAQVLGIAVGFQLVAGTGLIQRVHWLSVGITVMSGALSGLAVGFLLTPRAWQRRISGLAAAGVALATSTALATLAEARLGGWGIEPYWYRYALGAVIVAVIQTLIARKIWIIRGDRGGVRE